MKEKVELKFFTICDWKKEQEYLRRKHREGWKFTKVRFPVFYYFEEAEPEDVVYQLDYNPEGIANKAEYVQMFADCGWEYLQDFVGYSYFRKPVAEMQGEEEIFCDDASRLEMIRRVFKGRMLPLVPIFFCVLLPQLCLQIQIGTALALVFVALAVLYLVLFVVFGILYWNCIKAIENKK